uniref:Calponin-homology (CH) domain-containing protein n=1 Tax=Oncorhynchus kisutch TaxID=8019 RepID=A0A8C7LBK7_ONCKI
MASTGTEREEPHVPLDELRHPEPAFREAQKWIEEVTGKRFGEKDFRSGLENGILLCELLCSIRPGLVQKINRLPSPIAGLDNLSVFLRGCEELGLKGSQLFNPGDLQDTSIQANLRDSECSRKLKNVLITIFWLGKASSVCPSYDGPVLNLREFEGLRSHMRTLSEDRSGSDSVRPGVRDSGYDCWDSERSQSLSPRQHTRDNSLDSLDSIGSRSQTSPSPDVIIRGNSDVDSDGDAPNRKPDVRRDDMLARRTSAGESRTFVPFNQFLPNRNVSVPTARRRSRPQDGEHGSLPQPILEEGGGGEGGGPFKRPPGPRSRNYKTVTWAPDGEEPREEEGGLGQEEEVLKREVEKHRRLQRLEKAGIKVLPAVIRYGRPAPRLEQQEVKSPAPDIILRRHNDFLTNQKAAWDSDSEGEAEGEEGGGGVRRVPDVRRDDLASRRAPRPPTAPRAYQYIPPPACSLRDRELWEDIRRASHTALMDRMELETSHMGGVDAAHTPPPNPSPSPLSPEAPPTLLELEARLAQYERRVREEEEDGGRDERKVPDLQKDDMMARKTGAFPRTHNTTTTTFNRFLPLPGSKRPAQEVVTDRKLQQSRVSMDMPQQHPNVAMVVRPPVPSHCNYDDDDEDEEECPVPDLEKDDMLVRRTEAYQHSAGRTGRSFNLFLPVPGAAQQKNTPSGGPNQLYKNTPSGGPNQLYKNTPAGGPNQLYQNTPSGGPNQLYKNTPSGGPNQLYQNTPSGGPNQLYKNTPSGGPNQLYKNTPSGGPNQLYKNTPSGGPNQLYQNTPTGGPNQLYMNTPSGGPNQLYRHKQQPSSGVSTATGTEAPPSRTPTRKCLEDNPYLSSPSSPSTLLSSHTHTPPPTPPLPQLSGREKKEGGGDGERDGEREGEKDGERRGDKEGERD